MPVVNQVSCYNNTSDINTTMYTEFSVNSILSNPDVYEIQDVIFKDESMKKNLENTFKPKREWSNKFKEIPVAEPKNQPPSVAQDSEVKNSAENIVSEKKIKKCNCDDYNNYQAGRYQMIQQTPAEIKVDNLPYQIKPENLSVNKDNVDKNHLQIMKDRLSFNYQNILSKNSNYISKFSNSPDNYQYGYRHFTNDTFNYDWTKDITKTNPYAVRDVYLTAPSFNKYYAGKSIYKANTEEKNNNTKINSGTNGPHVRRVDNDTGEVEGLKSDFERNKNASEKTFNVDLINSLNSANSLTKRKPGRPKGAVKRPKVARRKKVPEFLRDLLLNPAYCPSIIMWEDYATGKFRFIRSEEVAKLWGKRNGNADMSFDKFSRAMRYYYDKDILVSVPETKLVYKFGPKGPDYYTDNPNFELYKWGHS